MSVSEKDSRGVKSEAAVDQPEWVAGDLLQRSSNFETGRRRQVRQGFETVAVAHGQDRDQATERARLIAAAPKMAAALEAVRKQWRSKINPVVGGEVHDLVEAALRAAGRLQ